MMLNAPLLGLLAVKRLYERSWAAEKIDRELKRSVECLGLTNALNAELTGRGTQDLNNE